MISFFSLSLFVFIYVTDRIASIEGYFNERMEMIRERRAEETRVRNVKDRARMIDSKTSFNKKVREHDQNMMKVVDKVRSDGDNWIQRVKELDVAQIIKTHVDPYKITKYIERTTNSGREAGQKRSLWKKQASTLAGVYLNDHMTMH